MTAGIDSAALPGVTDARSAVLAQRLRPAPADPAALVERLTIAGLESSGVKVFGLPVPAGHSREARGRRARLGARQGRGREGARDHKHPNADKLKLVKLDYGAAEPKTVVTGATNIAPGQSGMKVVLGLRGTGTSTRTRTARRPSSRWSRRRFAASRTTRCACPNFELGISDEHEGIIILDDADPAPGTPLQDVLGEIVVELDVLPNMARCLSMIGIAREVAALTGAADARSPNRRLATVAETIDGKVDGRDRRPEALPALHRDGHPQRDGRPGAAAGCSRGCTTPGCGRSTTSWTSPTT